MRAIRSLVITAAAATCACSSWSAKSHYPDAAGTSAAGGAEVVTKYDRFTARGQRAFRVKLAESRRFVAVIEPNAPSAALRYFGAFGSGPHPALCSQIDMLADGQPVPLGPSAYKRLGGVPDGSDMVEAPADRSALAMLASARVVEGRACGREFRLTPADLATLRRWVATADKPIPPTDKEETVE